MKFTQYIVVTTTVECSVDLCGVGISGPCSGHYGGGGGGRGGVGGGRLGVGEDEGDW